MAQPKTPIATYLNGVNGPELDALAQALDYMARDYDVIVYGATEAGVMAASASARTGARTLLISDTAWIGWMSGKGVVVQDVNVGKTPGILGGATRRFFERLVRQETLYKTLSWWWRLAGSGRPSWYERAWAQEVDHPLLMVLYNAQITALEKGVNADGEATILSITVDTGKSQTSGKYRANKFVEGSDVGALNQRALTSKSLGREASSLYSESNAGVRAAAQWPGTTNVDPYLTPGDAGSGVCFGVDTGALGTVGDGDGRVMGFCYRIFLTSVSAEQRAWPTRNMAFYNAAHYELLARAFAANPTYYGDATNGLTRVLQFYDADHSNKAAMGPDFIPYADLNTLGPLSTNYPDEAVCREYITASASRQAEIRQIIREYTIGLFWWLLNSPDARIPAPLRTALSAYAPSKRELIEYDGWSPQLYVREGVRAVGDFVLNQNNCTVGNGYPDLIGFGHYFFDSHAVRNVIVGGKVYYEGNQLGPPGNDYGFKVPLRVLLPKRSECVNLVCASQPSISRQVWLSLRVAPSMMQIGEAAGILAALAALQDCAVHDIHYSRVVALQDIQGIYGGITRTSDAVLNAGGTVTKTGTWTAASSRFGFFFNQYDRADAGSNAKWKWQPPIFEEGFYRVLWAFSPADTIANGDQGRATNAIVKVSHADGVATRTINQLWPGGPGGRWVDLGAFYFRKGDSLSNFAGLDYIEVDANGSDGYVTHAAFTLVKV